MRKMLDPIAGSPATTKSVSGIILLFEDDLFGTSGTEMEHRVLARRRKDIQVGSEDWNDVTFTGRRIRWMKNPQLGSYIEVSQEKAPEKLEEITIERKTKKNLFCTPAMHTRYRTALGQKHWLQIRTQFQCCYKFSRCASKAASQTIGDVKPLNKLARPVRASETRVQATYKPIEDNRICGCVISQQRSWIFIERHDSVFGRITWTLVKGRHFA